MAVLVEYFFRQVQPHLTYANFLRYYWARIACVLSQLWQLQGMVNQIHRAVLCAECLRLALHESHLATSVKI